MTINNQSVGHGCVWVVFLVDFMAGSTKWRPVQFDITKSPTVVCVCKLLALTALNFLLCGRWCILRTQDFIGIVQ